MFTPKTSDNPENRQAAALEELAKNSAQVVTALQNMVKALAEIQKSNQAIANNSSRRAGS